MVALLINDAIESFKDRWVRILLVSLAFTAAMLVVWLLLVGSSIKTITGDAQTAAAAAAAAEDDLAAGGAVDLSGIPTADSTLTSTDAAPSKAAMGMLFVGLLLMMVISTGMYGGAVHAITNEGGFRDDMRAGLRSIPTMSAQLSVISLPLLVPMFLTVVTGSMLLMVLTTLIGLAFAVGGFGLASLAVVESVAGEGGYVPRSAWRLFRSSPGAVTGAGVLTMLSSMIPLVGGIFVPCMMVATWRMASNAEGAPDGAMLTGVEPTVADDGTVYASADSAYRQQFVDPTQATHQNIAHQAAIHQQAATVIAPSATPAQVIEAILNPGTPHTEWVGVAVAGPLLLQLAWSEGPPPTLHLADQAGSWVPMPGLDAQGCLRVELQPGWYAAYITAQGQAPQSARLAVHPPVQVGAA